MDVSNFRLAETVGGNQVVIYTEHAEGTHPIHGAYYVGKILLPDSTIEADLGWVMCSWQRNGRRFKDYITSLDLLKFESIVKEKQSAEPPKVGA